MSFDQIFHLTPDDDLASLREKFGRTQAQTVILVVPNNAPVLRNVANMGLLRRYASQMGVSVVLVTRDGTTESLARRQGFAVYSALTKIPAKRRGGLSKDDLRAAAPLPRVPFYRYLVKLGCLGLALIVLAAGAAVLAGLAVFLAPSATITLTPATKALTISFSLLASPQIRVVDSAKGQFPANPIQVLIEDSGQIDTTGVKRVPDATASGTVVFANRSQTALSIPKGTTLRTATGVSIRFRTEEEASVPAGASSNVRVPIKAIDPGPNGNVKAGAINIVEGTLSFQVSVLNDEDIKGGTEKQIRYVTLQDRTTLRELVVQKIKAKSYDELSKAIKTDDVLPAETLTLSVNEVVYDKTMEAEGAFLGGKVRATVSGLVLAGDSLKEMVAVRLSDQTPGGFVILPQAVSYGAPTNVAFSDGVVSLQLSATARSQAQISRLDVQRAAAGKTPEAATRDIAAGFALASAPQIETTHTRLGRMPFLTSRITVIITN